MDATNFEPELFEEGCNRPLPVNRIVDEYEIGEVIALRVLLGDVFYPILLDRFGKKHALDYLAEFEGARDWRGSLYSYASALGGVSADDLASNNVNGSLAPVVEAVEISSPLEVLATSRVAVGGQTFKVELTPNASRSLLRGEPAVLRATDEHGVERRLELAPTLRGNADAADGGGGAADTRVVVISDLGQFLALRTLTVNGRASQVRLSAPQVRALVSKGRTQVQFAGSTVELTARDTDVSGAHSEQPRVTRYAATAATSTPAPTITNFDPTPHVTVTIPPTTTTTPPVQDTDDTSRPQSRESLPLALYMPVKHSWELRGYSRGALLHSVGLAPQEELTLEIHSWQKFTTGTETTTATESTSTAESTDTTRDSHEVLNDVARTNDLRNNLGGNLSYSGYGFNINLNGGAGDVNTVTDTFRDTTTNLHELVVKTTNQLKSSRQVKVTEGSDIGSEERVTRRLRNPNTCHALAIDTFEVLAHYKITTTIIRSGARLCVLIENPLQFGFFTRDVVREHETILSQILLDPNLRGGFAAARLLAEREVACAVACQRCICGDPRAILLGSGVSDAITRANAAAQKLKDNSPVVTLSWVDAIIGPHGTDSNAVVFDPHNYEVDKDRLHRWIYGALLKLGQPRLYELLIDPGAINWSDPVSATRSILAALGTTDPDTLRPETLLARYQLGLEEALYQRYRKLYDEPQGGKAAVVRQTRAYWGISARDEGLADALKALVAAAQPNKDSDAGAEQDPVAAAYPVGIVSQALEREDALLAHLNENRDYYRSIVFMSLPVQTQLELLRSRGYDFPGIDLRPVGRAGSLLAFRLISLTANLRKYFEALAVSNAQLDPICGEADVVLPTAGIHLQTRLSERDACEPYIDDIRAAEVAKRNAEAEQAQLEAQRYKKRLEKSAADPTLLDNPAPTVIPPLHVIVDQQSASQPPAT